MDINHLVALQAGLAHEKERLAFAKTEGERSLRSVWISQYEKQISDEKTHLGIEVVECEMSDDELLAELGILL